MVVLALLIAAFVLLLLEGVGVPSAPRFRLGWIGLTLFVLAALIPALGSTR